MVNIVYIYVIFKNVIVDNITDIPQYPSSTPLIPAPAPPQAIYIHFKRFCMWGFSIYRGNIVLFVYTEIIYLIYFYINKGDWEL